MKLRHRPATLLTLVIVGVAACLDSSESPAGTLRVVLSKPAGADGAILFTLAGPRAPATAKPGAGLVFWGAPFGAANPVKVLLTGALANGQTILTFNVNDVHRVDEYTATILQVAADGGTYAQRNAGAGSGYALTVTR